jgi:hypothetical protein
MILLTGLWLRRSGDQVIVSAEFDGKWRDVIVESIDGSFSHIVEPSGMLMASETLAERP